MQSIKGDLQWVILQIGQTWLRSLRISKRTKNFVDSTVLNLMNVIFISEKVELLERLKTAMAIRSHSKRNLINGETK
tara:strand:+ start:335 stop:565 length:231 start_codon:yes stop_codon:yes gene_type:complete